MFTLKNTTEIGRRGSLTTPHGTIETPFFMPVGTCGAMKGISHRDLLDLDAQILLSNTYHFMLQPGEKIVKDAGGLHEFIGWKKPMLTDSGGYQVFSLRGMSKISDDGVKFQSHLNGDSHFLSPEDATRIQHDLGADMIMCFDECPPSTASRKDIEKAVDRTLAWAKRCKDHHLLLSSSTSSPPQLFGIVQGGLHFDLRKKCIEELIAIGFDGYALGGLAVGEGEDELFDVVRECAPLLPEDQPRYLMGVGGIEQLKTCVSYGIDMFDCVLPVREARHGSLFLSDGSTIRMQRSEYRNDHSIIDPDSPSEESRLHSKSYLHHLIKAKERYGETISIKQNLGMTLRTMKDLRAKIEKDQTQ